jgi:large subunit ribosomal protein L35
MRRARRFGRERFRGCALPVRSRLAFEWPHQYTPPLNPAAWLEGHASPPMNDRSRTKDDEMPKLKTKSGAKKRFGRTGTGKIKANVAHKRHRLISKPKQMKRKARGTFVLEKGDTDLVLTYMPYHRS